MDQQQTHQTEKFIAEMLEFLESSSEDENDLDQQTNGKCIGEDHFIQKDFNDNIVVIENVENKLKTKKDVKPISYVANELKKLRQEFHMNSKEIGKETILGKNHEDNPIMNNKIYTETLFPDFKNLDWQFELENHCRRNYNNTYTQEVYKAIYQDTSGHPPSGSADYYQAAQNYVLYGKHFLDFPKNLQELMNDKISQNSTGESSNLIPNFGNSSFSKANLITPNITSQANGGFATGSSAAAYYQVCNNIQSQARPTLATNPGNSSAYGIFLGNKVTYVAGTPTTPSLIYNQQNTTTATNFISNSLANAALATSPTILYTNPLLTTTTQQYLTQFLSAAALTANSTQLATVSTNAGGTSVYERLIYAQMLQQQLYQTQQQAATIAAMFQQKYRVLNPAARQTASVINANNNRSSPQNLTASPLPCNTNGLTLNTCNRQARSTSPSDMVGHKSQNSIIPVPTETSGNTKITTD